MKITDRVYGEIEISNEVLAALVGSPEMQRLKGISQAGYIEPFFPGTDHSRFSHSLGVCHLLSKFGAPLEEQIAGLLHDISHTAFSHCIDYALAKGSEDAHSFQDDAMETFLRRSTIPAILAKMGVSLDYILDSSHFPLLEQELPDLCADRIDYILRTGIHTGKLTQPEAGRFLSDLKAIDRQWVFSSEEIAKQFAEYFLKINLKYYSGIESAIMFRAVGDVLRYCFEKKILSEEDMFLRDAQVLQRIQQAKEREPQLDKLWQRMNNKVVVKNNPVDFDAVVNAKSRVVDPLFLEGSRIERLSERWPKWAEVVQTESVPKVYHLKFQDSV